MSLEKILAWACSEAFTLDSALTEHSTQEKSIAVRCDSVVQSEDDDVLNLVEAAAFLRVHPVTLRKRAVQWGVPHKRLGSEWRFSRAVLTHWIQEAA
jgi:hypothetical protein